MATTSTTVVAEMNSRKKLLCRELESTIKLAIAESSKLDEKPLSSEIGQSIFGVIEALFIHGLRDAFFLRGSRHSKHPIPNFWPFISKNTHRSIKQQISELGQIRTEVGKARAWIRIVLAENTLEHYLNLFVKDSQISQFYDKSAFIRDPECIEIFNKSLKALGQIQICAATNSSLLNNWTPTPLILAGLIQGNIMPKVPSNLPSKNEFEIDEFAGVENEPEMGINAMDLLEEKQTLNSSTVSGQTNLLLPFSPQSTSRQIDEISSECSEEIDENESVLSHPSILEEFNNFYASGPSNKFRQQQQFMPTILGILPDENTVEDEEVAQKVDGPKVEYSSEVIVHRRKIGRRRAVSRSSCGSEGNLSGIINVPKNQANNEQISENVANEKQKATEIIEIEQNKDDAKEIPLGMSLQEELLLAEKPQICGSVPRITSDPQLNEPIGQRRMAEFTICSTDSSTNDLPQTFDEALREFLQRENSQEEIKKEKEMEEQQNDGQSNNSAVSSSANLEHSSSTESSAENLQIETIKDSLQIGESMEKTTTICIMSPSRELAQIPFERDENDPKAKEEDGNQMVEILPFDQKLGGDIILDQQLATNEQQSSYSLPRRLLFLTKLPMEMGLDAQNFRCKSCRRNIGVGFGPFKMCALTGHYHCDLCMGKSHHHESLIPARALLNGDFQKRAVSSQSWALLRSIASQPLFRVDFLNPQIYKFHKQLRKIKDLRKKLGLLVMYLLSCKNSIADDIKRRLWPHNHLHTDTHLYSISDLEGVADGSLERRLNAMCTFANDHIQNCALCIQKGFFCELCSSDRPIYPFQIETTYQCAQCSSCFHRECAAKFGLIEDKIFANRENHQKISSTSTNSSLNPPNCPKCLRRVKYSSAALNSLAKTSTIINTN